MIKDGSSSFVVIRMFEKVNDIFKVNDCMFDKIPFRIILIEVWIIVLVMNEKTELLMSEKRCVDKTELNKFNEFHLN